MYLNFAAIVASFLAAPANTNALGGITQSNVVQDFTNYLNAYDAWAASSTNFSHNTLYNAAITVQTNMVNDVGKLINGL